MKEMKEEHLLFAVVMIDNQETRTRFLWKLQSKQSFFDALRDMREEYIFRIEQNVEGGFPLRPEDRAERDDALMLCVAYLFAGLCSLNNHEVPDISPELVEEMHAQCDTQEVLIERHNFLSSPPDSINEQWAANFVKLYSAQNINSYGRGLMYALAMAWVYAVEEEGARAERTSDVESRAEKMRAESPGFMGELDQILKEAGFGEERESAPEDI